MNKTRFEAFSDGVYAFAATLLILAIALPAFRGQPGERELTDALLHLWPSVLAYALSFAVIGIMWQNHHALFRLVERIDRTTVLLNLLLLSVTAFVPFATSTLGAFPSLRPAAFLYGLTLTGSAIGYNLLLGHLVRSGAFGESVTGARVRQTVVAYRVGAVTYGLAMLTALVAPLASIVLYALIVGYFLLPRGVDDDLSHSPRSRERKN